jgi:FkbM family methyltransferase
MNDAQMGHPRLASVLRSLGGRVARGEGTVRRGPAAGLRIDATGRMPGYVLGTADYEEQLWVAEHLGRSDTFYDIGANIGFFTLLAAKLVGPEGTVIAFEPLPSNVEQLQKNVALNNYTNVAVVAAAVSAEETVGQFSLTDARDAGRLVEENSDESNVRVPVTTVDATWRDGRLHPPSMIKIDVEGEEINVLRGCRETLISHRPVLLVEVHWLGKRFLDFCELTLGPLGYEIETTSGDPVPSEPARYHAVLRVP